MIKINIVRKPNAGKCLSSEQLSDGRGQKRCIKAALKKRPSMTGILMPSILQSLDIFKNLITFVHLKINFKSENHKKYFRILRSEFF